MKLIDYLKQIFTVDLRALALLRIGMASLILLDLSIRFTDIKAHYSDEGVLPLNVMLQHNWSPWNLSIHNISVMWQVQAVLFLVAAFFGACLLIGWKTRLVSIVSWFLLMSLHYHNPLILQGGDDLLRMMLFWGIFLPWGDRYSMDQNKKDKTKQITTAYFGMASIGYVVQIFCVYFFSALLKNSPEWKSEGTAIYYALSLDQMVLPMGKLIYPYPELLKWLTFSVYYMELLIPFFLFLPGWNSLFRKIAIVVLVLFHIGIAATLFVGLFFLIGIVSMSGLFPGGWMDRIEEKVSKGKNGAVRFMHIPYNHIFINTWSKIKSRLPCFFKIGKESALVLVLIFIISWNLKLSTVLSFNIPEQVRGMGRMLGLVQNWGMFAPSVFKDDGWYILEGTTYKNEIIDISQKGLPVNYTKPDRVVSNIKNDRWRKFSENYLFVSNSYMRSYFCNFALKEWNACHPEQPINDLKIIYMKEVTQPDYKYVQPTREVLTRINIKPE